MPDIPNRESLERRAASALKKLRGEQLARLKAYLGNPPDARRVPDKFWKEIEDDDRELLLLLLLPLAIVAFDKVAEIAGLEIDREKADRLVKRQIDRRAAQVAREGMRNTRSGLKDLLRRLQREAKGTDGGGLIDEDDLDDGLEILFGDDRNEATAITETTGANSRGEMAARDEAEKQGKVVLVTWQTERDSRVCPICAPLHGKPEQDWVELFPDGPPSHPRCRCVLKIEVDRTTTDDRFRTGF